MLSNANFADFEMHNANGFVIDDRPQTEYPIWRAEPCIRECKDSVEIIMRASVLDVTPEESASQAANESASALIVAAASI